VQSYLNPTGQITQFAQPTCVGEPVTLSITGTNDIPNYNFVTGYNWHLPNAIKNFQVTSGTNPGNNPRIQLSSADTSGSSLTLYYPVVQQAGLAGTASTTGTEIISCDLSLITGGTCTVTGTLNLVAPTVQVTGSQSDQLRVLPGYTINDDDSASIVDGELRDGMDGTAQTLIPPSPFASGSTCWAQTINQVSVSITGSNNARSNPINSAGYSGAHL
jgi:hypothetical protein